MGKDNRFDIVGLGPGHPDYMLPIAKKRIEEAELIVCAERHEAALREAKLDIAEAHVLHIEGQISKLPEIIDGHRDFLKTVIVVSGDPGFHSLLKLVSSHYSPDEYRVTAGVSSLQYGFAALGIPYQEAYIGSVHGQEAKVVDLVGRHAYAGFLTDGKNTPAVIAKQLLQAGMEDVTLHVGEKLSYADEQWTHGKPKEVQEQTFDSLSIVIIENSAPTASVK